MKMLQPCRTYEQSCCAGPNVTSRHAGPGPPVKGVRSRTWSKSTSTTAAGWPECWTTTAGPVGPLVGDDGARAAWLLAQHADQDPVFQKRCLDLLSKAVAKGEAGPAHLAYLTDRVQLKELGYETYGTQYQAAAGVWGFQPVNEPESLEERRLSVGLPPLAEQHRSMEETYGQPKVLASPRLALVRCPRCGSQLVREPPGSGLDFEVVCGAETTIRMG